MRNQIPFIGRRQCLKMTVGIKIKYAGHTYLTSHIRYHTIYPLLIIEAFVIFPVNFRMPEMLIIINR